jgi:hypothetical protein
MPTAKQFVLKAAEVLGRYKPLTPEETRLVQKEAVPFVGDIPLNAGGQLNQYRVEFETPRRLTAKVENLLYTPKGMTWLNGVLVQKYCVQEPSTKDVLGRPSFRSISSIPFGTIIQAETPYTYGDWVSEHLVTLSLALPIVEPLLMPQHLMNKSYIQRDLRALNIEAISVNTSVLVKSATVLSKPRPGHYWRDEEVPAYRAAFNIHPCSPKVGSLLYLSREGEKSESQDRQYPNLEVANIVRSLGGKVVVTQKTTYEEYCALAIDAETVIADHGGAMFNLLNWNTKNVIELFSDNWWTNCFLFLSKPLGVSNYALVNIDRFDAAVFTKRLTSLIEQFQQTSKSATL